jgi:putative ATP-dependent endonuclease of OLD family
MKYPYIHKVEIKNFRNFKGLSLIMESTSVIVGENRAGKSNFLDAIRLVLDPSLPDSSRVLRAEDFWDGLKKPFGGNVVEVKVFVRGFEDNKSAQSVLADCVIKSDPLTALLTYQFRPRRGIEAKEPTESEYEYVLFGGNDEKYRVAGEVRKWLAMLVLPALRDAESDMQSWKKSPLRPLIDRAKTLIDPDKLSKVRDLLDEATSNLVKEPAIKSLTKEINKSLGGMVGPIHSVETQFDFAPGEPEQLLRAIRLFLKEGQTRPLSDASLGTANILFLSLLLQELDMKVGAKEIVSTILAIEEPEAHLHPHLQRLLFRHFLRRGHSVLISTHSPNIASVAPLRSLVLLRVTPEGTISFTPRNLRFTQEESDDIQRYLDVTKAEMLFAKGVILVEGTAEQFLIPVFASSLLRKKKIAGSLDELGISVCSVNGTDFSPFKRLLSDIGLSIANVIVTDGDPRETKTGNKRKAGNDRGAQLLYDEETITKTISLIDEDKDQDVKDILESEGIFVGDNTLEIDLLDSLSEEIKQTFMELRGSKAAAIRFNAYVDGAAAGDEDSMVSMVERIERIGKGRFAQRLASKITDQKPPRYIVNAIDVIVSTVCPSNA